MKRWLYISFLGVLLLSCGKAASPPETLLVPQILSTEIITSTESVSLFASVGGPAHFTGCGFGVARDGLIRELESSLDAGNMSFSARMEGLEPDTDYTFYAFIANGPSRIQTPERRFHTLAPAPPVPDPPSVSFSSCGATPGTRTALLSATLSETKDISAVGFALSRDGSNFETFPATLSGSGFSLTVTDLLPGTGYSFYAWAVQRGETVTSQPSSFATEKETHTAGFTDLQASPEAFSVRLLATITDGTYVEACGVGLSRDGRTPVEYGAVLEGNAFSVKVDELQADTEYTWYAFLVIDGVRTSSGFEHFRTLEDPTLRFLDIQASAGANSVSLRARLSRTEGVSACGFALAGEGGDFSRSTAALQQDGLFSLEIGDLAPETAYRFYAWAATAEGDVLSEVFSFTTKPASPEDIGFQSVSASVEGLSVMLEALLSSMEGVSRCGFGLSENSYDYIEYSVQPGSSGFRKTLEGLKPAATYYYYAFFALEDKVYQSKVQSFKTQDHD